MANPGMLWACLAIRAHAGSKSGKYRKSGLFCPIVVSSGLKFVSVLWMASEFVIFPPVFWKSCRKTAARASA